MKKLGLVISLEGLDLNKEEKTFSVCKVVTQTIKNSILNKNVSQSHNGQFINPGLDEEDRRKFYKICDIFDKAVKENLEVVELEDDWIGLIRASFRRQSFPTDLFRRVEENVIWKIEDR